MYFLRNFWYFAVRMLIKIGLYFFYKKITVTGQANIPKNASILFAANHENAFIDAFLVATHNSKLCNSLVRADVFRFKLSKLILTSLKMLPVYRIRDGYSSLKSNEIVFEACYKAFGNGESLMMFPEATHDDRRISRKLTKGISRLALGTVNSKLGTENLYVVPVGLDYSDHKKFRAEVQINYGEAIKVETQPLEVKYFDALRFKIQDGLEKTHIGLNRSNYEVLNQLMFDTEPCVNIQKYQEINAQGQVLNSAFDKDDLVLTKHLNSLKKLNGKFPKLPFNQVFIFLELLLAIILLPIFLSSALINGLLLALIYAIDKLVITDKIFVSSINFTVGLFLFPLLWYFEYRLLEAYYSSNYLPLAIVVVMPVSLIVFQVIKNFYDDLIKKFRAILQPKAYVDFQDSLAFLRAYKANILN